MEILKRALADTRTRFSLSLGTAVQFVLPATAFVVCIHLLRGEDAAMTEAADIILYIAAFFVAAVIPVFLWNLWLAPLHLAREVRTQKPTVPERADLVAWGKYDTFKLYGAACLWVGMEPHYPIVDQAAKDALFRLRHAIVLRELGFVTSLVFISETLTELFTKSRSTWRPTHDQKVTAIHLRTYADRIGNVPGFLQHVKIPEPGEDE